MRRARAGHANALPGRAWAPPAAAARELHLISAVGTAPSARGSRGRPRQRVGHCQARPGQTGLDPDRGALRGGRETKGFHVESRAEGWPANALQSRCMQSSAIRPAD